MARPRPLAAENRVATPWLVLATQRGDRHAEEELVRRYEPLVQRAVRGLKLPPWCENEDVAQEARLGLVTAMREWRAERGAFPAYAQRCVRNRALLAVISASRQKHHALNMANSLEENLMDDDPNQRHALRLVECFSTSCDAHTDPPSRLLVRERIDSVLRALPTLTASERIAIAGGLNGQTTRQLAEALSVTPKAVSQAAYRARRKFAAALSRAA